MYGQYSKDSPGKLTLGDQLPTGATAAKRAGHNRVVYTNAEGVRCFRLILTDIVTFEPETGIVTLDDGGFPSQTTRRAFGEAFLALGLVPAAEGWRGAYSPVGVWGARPKAWHVVNGIPGVKQLHFDRRAVLHRNPETGEFRVLEVGAEDPESPTFRPYADAGVRVVSVSETFRYTRR